MQIQRWHAVVGAVVAMVVFAGLIGCSSQSAAPSTPVAPAQAGCDDPQTAGSTGGSTSGSGNDPILTDGGKRYVVWICSPGEVANHAPDVAPLGLDEDVYEPREAAELDSQALVLVMRNLRNHYGTDQYLTRVPPAQQQAYLDRLNNLAYTNDDLSGYSENDAYWLAMGSHFRSHHKTHRPHHLTHKSGSRPHGYHPHGYRPQPTGTLRPGVPTPRPTAVTPTRQTQTAEPTRDRTRTTVTKPTTQKPKPRPTRTR